MHDERAPVSYHMALAHLDAPTPFGVLRAVERPTYDELLNGQIAGEIDRRGPSTLDALLTSGETWTVEG